jgi:DNA-directed RNA polymerase subunit RPC12/RpoP
MFRRLIRLPKDPEHAVDSRPRKKKAKRGVACPKCGVQVRKRALAHHLEHSCPGSSAKRRSTKSKPRDQAGKSARTNGRMKSRRPERANLPGPDRDLPRDRRPELHVCPDCGTHMRPDQVPYHLCADSG